MKKETTKNTRKSSAKQRQKTGDNPRAGKGGIIPPVEHQFKPGISGNPGGRPRVLSDAYRKMLATVNERDPEGRTNAELAAEAMKIEMLKGEIPALRELRSATEGERTRTIEDDIIDYLREGKLTPAQVRQELPDDAAKLIAAAGLSGRADTETGEAQAPSASPADADRNG
jgi:uncharacterized protein DUF5681